MNPQELLSQGMELARTGDRNRARDLIAKAVKADPSLKQGWWALAHLLEDKNQRIYCLKRVLKIDPSNKQARAKLEQLTGPPQPSAAPFQSPPPSHSPEPSRLPRTALSPQQLAQTEEPLQRIEQAPSPVSSRGRNTYFIVGVGVVGVILVAVILTLLFTSGVLEGLFGGGQTDYANLIIPTLPPTWTSTPSNAPEAEQTGAGVDPEGTPPPNSVGDIDDEVVAALELMHAGQYIEALEAWDAILTQDPQDHFAYFQRARASLELAQGEGSLAVYLALNETALTDANQAIALHPEENGDYYIARANAFENFSRVAENRVDQDQLIEIALDNHRMGVELPHTNPTEHIGPLLLMLRLGDCNEVLEEAERIRALRADGAGPSPLLSYIFANAYMCTGDFTQARIEAARATSTYPLCTYFYTVALAWYHGGNLDKALEELSFSINSCPNRDGYRYYLRALIYYELGRPDKAMEDILVGSFNTWTQGSLKAYVEGLLARDQGEQSLAIEHLKLAERTIDRSHGPFIERIQSDLRALEGAPENPTPVASPEATPIPALPEGHPTPLPVSYVKQTTGMGSLRLEPGEISFFHFYATYHALANRATLLRVYLIGPEEDVDTGIEIGIFNPSMKYWETIETVGGLNKVEEPDNYVFKSGDVIFNLRNTGSTTVELENLGIMIRFERYAGGNETFSYRDSEE